MRLFNRVKSFLITMLTCSLLFANISYTAFGGEEISTYTVSLGGQDIVFCADLDGGALPDNTICVSPVNGKAIKLNRPVKMGYTFKRWQYSYVNQNGKLIEKPIASIDIKAYETMQNLTGENIPLITAVFAENTYKIQFKATSPKKGVKLIKSKIKKLKNLKLLYESDSFIYPDSSYISAEGYELIGWTRDERAKKNPLGDYVLETSVKSLAGKNQKDKKVVLYSVWVISKAPTGVPSKAPTGAPSIAPSGMPNEIPPMESVKLPDMPKEPSAYLYVSTQATKEGNGSIESPFATIEAALDVAKPGTCIYLRGGKYSEQVYIEKSGSKTGGFISIKSYPGERAELTLPTGTTGAIFELSGCSYIEISNLTIGDISGKEVYGICMYQDVHNIFVRNNEIKNIVTTGKGDDGEANAILCFGEGKTDETAISDIYIANNKVHNNVNGWSENISVADNCRNVYIVGNEVYDCTNIGIDFCGNQGYCKEPKYDYPRFCYAYNNTVYNCVCDYAECAGIYADGASNVEISGNTVHGNPYGIEVGSEIMPKITEATVKNVWVHDNYIYENNVCGIILGGYTENNTTGVVTDTYIYNNKLVNNGVDKNLSNGELCFEKCNGITIMNNQIQRDAKNAPFIGSQMSGKYVKNIKLKGNTYYGSVEASDINFELPVGTGLKTITGIDSLNALDFAFDEKYVKGSIK